MNIKDFRIELLKEVEAFVKFWVSQQDINGESEYPSQLDENEWWEQFEAWLQVKSGETE